MKHLILLTLTWNFVLSSNNCIIGNGDTLYLDCDEGNYERIHTLNDKSVSCQLNELDDELRENIKIIKVNGCTFNELILFKNCTSVHFLNVRETKSIGRKTFIQMKQLQHIKIDDTNIEVLASAFSDLPNLRDVSIDGKYLNISKLAFQGANQLKLLHIADSSMASLPPGFFHDLNNLETLTIIGLNSSELSTFDFTGLENLKLLFFNGNRITNVTGKFDVLKNLKYLFLSDNHLRHIDSMAFSHMHNLILLDLERNDIGQLNASTFSGLTHLRTLNLASNDIYYIENGAFAALSHLKKFDLSNNRLRALDEYTFSGLDNLQYLSLKRNLITAININTFSSLTKLIQLDLSCQDGLVTIHLNAFPQFIDLQGKTVIYTAIGSEPDDFESAELEWFKEILSYSKYTHGVDVIYRMRFGHFRLNENQDHQIDLRNLEQKIKDQTLIFGNLDLSNNRVALINVD